MSPIDKFMLGFLSPIKGLKLILSSKKKFLLSIFPFLLGFLVLGGVFLWAYQYLGENVESWVKSYEVLSGVVLSIVMTLVAIFSWVALTILAFLLGYVVISILGGPFYSMLSEEVFRTESSQGLKGSSFRLIFTMFFLSLLKISLFFFIAVFCFILSFVPIVNIFSTYIVFLVIAFDCSDYSFEIDYLSLRQRFSFIFKHFWEYSGLSVAIMCTTLIPGSFFILLPAFICGATKMYIQLENK